MKYPIFILFLIVFYVSHSQNENFFIIGEKMVEENKLDSAKVYYNTQLKVSNDRSLNAEIYLCLADIYKNELNNLEASKYYLKAFNLAKEANNVQLEFHYYVKMGEFFRRRHLIPQFKKELDKATDLLKKHKIEDKYLTKYYNRKAALFTELYNNNDSTLVYASKSLELAKKVNDKDNVFYSTLEIAGVYERKKEYKKSIKYIESILDYSEQNVMIQHHSDAYISYIMALTRDNQIEKALMEALNAKEFALENELLIDENHFNEYIHQIYLDLKNYEKAHEYLTYINDVTDKLNQIRTDKALIDLETKYKSKEKDNQLKITRLKIINKDKELVSNRAKLYLVLSLFLLVILVTLLIAYFLNKVKKSNKDLQTLSKENEFLLSEANHRINNNLQLVVILISDQLKKASTENSFQLKNILTKVEAISTLHKHLYKNNDKEKIEISNYLNDVKQSFLDVFNENNINTNFKIDTVEIPSNYAMYFGLLLTELSINSIKHAFNNQDNKTINVELRVKEKQLSFLYSDNGTVIMMQAIKPKLIDKICRQLKIKYTINTENGFTFSFQKDISNA